MKLIKKADALLLCCLLLLAGLCALPKVLPQKDASLTAIVSVGGKEWKRISLDKVDAPYELHPDCSPEVTITVEPGCIYYSFAQCKDKICVHTGKLDRAGNTAACLPSKTSIVVVGTNTDSPDIITY